MCVLRYGPALSVPRFMYVPLTENTVKACAI